MNIHRYAVILFSSLILALGLSGMLRPVLAGPTPPTQAINPTIRETTVSNYSPAFGQDTSSKLLFINPNAAPTAPSNLTALALSQQQILLHWVDNSNNELGFKIEQSLNGISGWSQIATTPANVTSHAPVGLNCGTTYYYRVRAFNISGNSIYSNTANATTLVCNNDFDYFVYLPLIIKSSSSIPNPTPTATPTRTSTPTPTHTPTPAPATAQVRVINNTGGTLNFSLSGPTSGSWTVFNGQSRTVNVIPGSYQITATAICGSAFDTFFVAEGQIHQVTYFCG